MRTDGRTGWKRGAAALLVACLFLLPWSFAAIGESSGFQFSLPRAIRSYSENIFRLSVPSAGSYQITVHDETTVYRILEGEAAGAGELDVLWDGAGHNEERLDQRRYTIDAVFEAVDGKRYEAQLSHTVGYTYQAVNFALPSSAILNLNDSAAWFLEVKAVMDGTLTVDWIPEDPTGETLTARAAISGGKVTQYAFRDLMKSQLPEKRNYTVHVYDPRNPDYGKSFSVTVTDEPLQEEALFLTGDLLPPEGADDRTIWDWMMRPSIVVDIGFHQHQKIYREADSRSDSLGTVHGQTQALQVLDLRTEGWARVGAWNHESGAYVEGWVPTDRLKVVYPETDYGLLFNKKEQTLVVYYRGKALDTIAVSTGKADEKHPDYETPAGSYLTGTHRGSFSSNGKKFDYVIQYDGGNMIHQIPYWWKNGRKDFSAGSTALGEKASHGCIRVQAMPSEQAGINAYWLWTHIPYRSRVLILDD